VFDYAEPFESYAAGRREHVMAVAARTASLGEPWLSLFDPCELSEMLRGIGFGEIEDLGLAELTDRFYRALKARYRHRCGPPRPAGTAPGARDPLAIASCDMRARRRR
jgi:O-methyltransferase involved in polyketide biosynthesis